VSNAIDATHLVVSVDFCWHGWPLLIVPAGRTQPIVYRCTPMLPPLLLTC
jgi:hypothetical protein